MAKTAKQLDADIKAALAGGDASSTPKRLTTAQIKKLQVELRKAIKVAQADADQQSRHMKHDDYERAAEDATRVVGIRTQTAAQPFDEGVEIWEVIPGKGTVDDQIAEYHDDGER